MAAVELTLPVTKIEFVRWLRSYVAASREVTFPAAHGTISVHKVAVWRPSDIRPSVTINGIQTITDEELIAMPFWPRMLADTLRYKNQIAMDGIIQFWLRQKGRRLKVKMAYSNLIFVAYFEILVSAIRNQWPKKTLQRLADPSPEPNPEPVTSPVPQRLGGRPANADDEWAWCEVRLNGRSQKEVYGEWLRRIGQRASQLVDTWDSFQKAVKPNRLAAKYGKTGEVGASAQGK